MSVIPILLAVMAARPLVPLPLPIRPRFSHPVSPVRVALSPHFLRSPRVALCALFALCTPSCAPTLLAVQALRRAAIHREVLLDAPVRGDTRHPDARAVPRCAAHDRDAYADQGWSFTAQESRSYTAHVRALHDATVSVYEGDRELRCDDDGAALGEPRLSFNAVRGGRYTIVVDGYQGAQGPYELTLSRAP